MTAEELIKKYTPECYLKAYPCLCGYWVLSYWVREYPENGEPIQKGDEITQKQADEMLTQHLAKLVLPLGEWTNNQQEALKSVIHYLQDDWDNSTLKQALEAKDFEKAKEIWLSLGMPEWRQEEVELFFGVDNKS